VERRSPVDELREEHAVLRDQVRNLADAIAGFIGVETGRLEDATGAVREQAAALRSSLLLHFRKEEDGLFPDVITLVSAGAPEGDIVAHFFSESADDDLRAHALLRGRLEECEGVLAQRVGSGSEAAWIARLGGILNGIRDLLLQHVAKEDDLVFPMVERLLDELQMAAVRDRLDQISESSS
jgi:iron-sulfur cluster repair protein YtfE (RIC family)